MPPPPKRKKREKYKSALNSLSDQLSSGVGVTGIVNACSINLDVLEDIKYRDVV